MLFFEINFTMRVHCLRAVTPSRSAAGRAVSPDVAGRGWMWLRVGHKLGRMFAVLTPGEPNGEPNRLGQTGGRPAVPLRSAALTSLSRCQCATPAAQIAEYALPVRLRV